MMNCNIPQHKKPVSTQVKPLNENVQKYLRCIKRLERAYIVTEFAEVAGVSRKCINYNADKIEAYYQIAPPPTEADLKWFDARSIDYYLKNTIDTKSALGAIVGYLLKYRYGLLGHLRKVSAIKTAGQDTIKLVVAIKSRKHGTGTPIQSNSKAVKNLSNHNKIAWIDALFIRSGGYYAGHTAKLWKTTELTDKIISDAISIFFDKIANIQPKFIGNYIFGEGTTNTATYSSICSVINVTLLTNPIITKYQWYDKLLFLSFGQVQNLCLSSMLHIISQTIAIVHGHFIVSLNHTSKTNPTLGRNYNVFTRLRSAERKQLDFINYDISAALQTISLQLIQATETDYPLLTRYSKDKQFKGALREDIAKALNVPIVEVKQKLTAFANGAVSGVDKHIIYKQFQSESDKLRLQVLVHTADHTPQLLEQAKAQSRRQLPEDIDWFSANTEDSQALARSKSSVYFFIWTHYERLIRKAMLIILTDGIEVHDAVYSKMDVSTNIIEVTIFESTGFKIIIEKD